MQKDAYDRRQPTQAEQDAMARRQRAFAIWAGSQLEPTPLWIQVTKSGCSLLIGVFLWFVAIYWVLSLIGVVPSV